MHVLAKTSVSRPVAMLACVLFVATVFTDVVIQHVVELPKNIQARQAEVLSTGAAITPLMPEAYRVVDLLPGWQQVCQVRSPQQAWALLDTRDRIDQFTQSLSDSSVLWQHVTPYTQAALSGALGGGTKDVCVGRDGVLFYRPDVEYVIGSPFMDKATQARRKAAQPEVATDPAAAIIDFHQQLRRRGITLVVLPVPSKTCVTPQTLGTVGPHGGHAIHNASFAEFKARLAASGVLVLDVSDNLAQFGQSQPAFLKTDSHWQIGTMELTARLLAEFVRGHASLDNRAMAYRRRQSEVENLGDLARMLRLPQDQRYWLPESVTIHPVTGPTSEPWRADASADVLLLGDSYTNIYSVDGMGWGASAGLAEQLSVELQRPVDRISRNDAGAWASRAMLCTMMSQGRNRLAGKKVVIWQFAIRELSEGDWMLLSMPE